MMSNILKNKGDKSPAEVDRLLRSQGWTIVRSNKHNVYSKTGVEKKFIVPRHKVNWKNLYDNCRRLGVAI